MKSLKISFEIFPSEYDNIKSMKINFETFPFEYNKSRFALNIYKKKKSGGLDLSASPVSCEFVITDIYTFFFFFAGRSVTFSLSYY